MVYADVADANLRTVLAQTSGGKEIRICYARPSLNKTEANYRTTTEVVVWGLIILCHFLIGQFFEVLTDNSSLYWVCSVKEEVVSCIGGMWHWKNINVPHYTDKGRRRLRWMAFLAYLSLFTWSFLTLRHWKNSVDQRWDRVLVSVSIVSANFCGISIGEKWVETSWYFNQNNYMCKNILLMTPQWTSIIMRKGSGCISVLWI